MVRRLAAAVECGSKLPHSKRSLGERWPGGHIFKGAWQSFRTRKHRELELISSPHTYAVKGRHTVAVEVIDIFGNDTMVLMPATVG